MPHPSYASTPGQSSPSPEMLSTAANTVSTLLCCVWSPVRPLSASLPPPQGCKWKKEILPNALPQHLLMVDENFPLLSSASHISSVLPHLLPTLAQLLLGPCAPGSHTPPHEATTNVTLAAAAGMCARRKHCHHNFCDNISYFGHYERTKGWLSSKIVVCKDWVLNKATQMPRPWINKVHPVCYGV